MNTTLRRQLRRRKKQLLRRIDKHEGQIQTPMIRPPRATYEQSGVTLLACGSHGRGSYAMGTSGRKTGLKRCRQ